MMGIHPDRSPDSTDERICIVIMKHKTRGPSLLQIFWSGIDHGVYQSTYGMDDGNRSIKQAVLLIQSTWFKSTGHQIGIRTRLDAMRESFVKSNLNRNFAWITVL